MSKLVGHWAGGQGLLLRWLLWTSWQSQPGRWVSALLTVSLGIALAVAIHSVNRSALSEFSQAIDVVNGQASVQLASPLGPGYGINDRIFDALWKEREDLGIAQLSPVLEVQTDTLLVLGIDLFRAASVSPGLLPRVSPANGQTSASPQDVFSGDALFLSAAALAQLQKTVGDRVDLQYEGRRISLRIAGELPGVVGQSLGVMDLGLAQWRFNRLGKLSRFDLALASTQSAEGLRNKLEQRDIALWVVRAEDRAQRLSHISRAYRVNLTVLALVALLTGGFLVYSALSLSVLRQHSQMALLCALGAPASFIRRWVFAQGLLMTGLGGGLGVILGLFLAKGLLAAVGGDLGGGYFRDSAPALQFALVDLFGFWLLALGLGIWSGFFALRRIQVDRLQTALRAGVAETLLPSATALWGAVLSLVAAACLLLLPPVNGIPIFAYAAIAGILFASVLSLPFVIGIAFKPISPGVSLQAIFRSASSRLALWRLAQSPAAASTMSSGVLAAVSLTVAMAVMVTSFRISVSDWLEKVLPADIYASAQEQGSSAVLDDTVLHRILELDGVQHAELSRQSRFLLAPDRPEVTLLVRPIDERNPATSLPLVGAVADQPLRATRTHHGDRGPFRIFVSEAMVDLYGLYPGQTSLLPIATVDPSPMVEVWVAGVFRDYGRQHGTVVISDSDFAKVSPDQPRTGLAIWLVPHRSAQSAIDEIRQLGPPLDQMRFTATQEIRAISLRIFDRSFALTYALELAALIVAVVSVASGFTGQVMVRRKEFALLAHLGQAARDRLAQVVGEAIGLLSVTVIWGSLIGMAISQILIHWVNPQSFHWTMDTHIPSLMLLGLGLAMLMLGALASGWAALRTLKTMPAQALKEDW